MKKIFVILLSAILVFSLASCGTNQTNGVLKAWTGDYSEEQFVNAINEYQTNYKPIVSDGKTKMVSVSFDTDFEISSCSVPRVSFVDNNDIDAELSGGICLAVETTFDGKEVTVSTDWWLDASDWTKDYPIWSYLVCVKDMDGVAHYYYFRTDYSSIA
ncbi:MAG: hypothetical protein IKY59_02160 [Oscillospiraceae bacterium]|nr:hypothetical protein [Oscillospiraceae bacterium]